MDPKTEIKTLMARMARTSRADEKYMVLELINKLSPKDRGFALVQKARTLGYLNNQSEALEAAQQAIQECQRSNDQPMLLAAYVTEINAHSRLDTEESRKSIRKAEELLDGMSTEIRKKSVAHETHLLLVKGNRFFHDGEFKKAIEAYEASVEVGKTIPEEEYYGIRWYWSYINLAELFLNIGDLDKAYECMKQYLEGSVNDPRTGIIAYPIANMGLILLEKGDFEEARSYLQKSLDIVLQSGDEGAICDIHLYLFRLAMAEGNLVEAKSTVSKLRDLSEVYKDNILINSQFTLANAILLKESTNVRDWIKAQDLLINLVDKFDFQTINKILTMKHLCDTYLDEIKLHGHEQAFYKAQNVIEQLTMLAANQNSMRVLVESYLLRARMKLIDGDFDEAEALYYQAETTCEENGLKTLGDHIQSKKSEFELDLKHMQNLLTRNATLQERLKQANIDDYLQEALHMVRK
ncbi:MAG: tetratricopeptide repeat protein [Candidatus Kariarchaeaceae archaeon]